MRLMNPYQLLSRYLIAMTAIVLIISVPMSSVHAMVIAPSKIVTIGIDESNYRHSEKADNIDTVKAIIWYPIASDCTVDIDAFDITMRLNGIFEIEAETIRYVYDEDNLIIEFDRNVIVDILLREELTGVVSVEVYGTFMVYDCDETECDGDMVIDQISEIFSYDPGKGK